jgi:hypothetical protein
MKIFRIVFRVTIIFLLLFLVTRTFKKADESDYLSIKASHLAKGNSPDSIRYEIIKQLKNFQYGYSGRDLTRVESFMEELYSKDNILILGTMPKEVYKGFEQASMLVRSDWESWGDCKFETERASISSSGNTAWFSTIGFVKFDMSSLLVIPLRLTGIMVKENGDWKFQQQQFQFDIDFSLSLPAIIILFIWLIVSMITLVIAVWKRISLNRNTGLNSKETENRKY